MSTARNTTSTVRRRAVPLAISLTLAAGGCSEPTPPVSSDPPTAAAPATPPATPPTSQPFPPAPPFPNLTRPGDIYIGDPAIYQFIFSFHQSQVASRYVFYDDGTFGLQFSSVRWGFFEYPGRFIRADSLIMFDFGGRSTAGPWDASGTVRGDSLMVRYNELMLHSDFADGWYVRASSTP